MFKHTTLSRLKPSRLRRLMLLFFFAMALPTAVLVYKSYDQLKWEAFYQHRLLAEELSERINQQFDEFVSQEQKRSFEDYRFANGDAIAATENQSKYLQRSALSSFPIINDTPGVIGYFQIDADGQFSTPLLPNVPSRSKAPLLTSLELKERGIAESKIEEILSTNQLVAKREQKNITVARSELLYGDNDIAGLGGSLLSSNSESLIATDQRTQSVLNQAAFDRLSEVKTYPTKVSNKLSKKDNVEGRLKQLELESPYKEQVDKREVSKQKKSTVKQRNTKAERLEKTIVAKSKAAIKKNSVVERDSSSVIASDVSDSLGESMVPAIKIFESDIDPFEISLLESGHFVLYRKVWRNGQRYIQGILVQQAPFIDGLINNNFTNSLLYQMSALTVVYQGNALASFSNSSRPFSRVNVNELDGTLLYRTSLSEPFNQLENVFTIRRLPAGPGGKVILWAAFIMSLVLSIGIFLLYRMSLRNLSLVSQQQDFVSAVSHELKTPLTSIRMYGEILHQGWAEEEKKKSYYRYIFEESERLTRLINNVLELARMTRNETRMNLKTVTVAELVDLIHSKIDSQIERADFRLNLTLEGTVASSKISIDPDVFVQIVINLVDNALKFSAAAENRTIDITASKQSNNKVCFKVRDYGPGIAKDQLKKIFELFYRSENELTRETTGTGIGLALVSQLTQLMKGAIEVVNRQPGAEFRLFFSSKNS